MIVSNTIIIISGSFFFSLIFSSLHRVLSYICITAGIRKHRNRPREAVDAETFALDVKSVVEIETSFCFQFLVETDPGQIPFITFFLYSLQHLYFFMSIDPFFVRKTYLWTRVCDAINEGLFNRLEKRNVVWWWEKGKVPLIYILSKKSKCWPGVLCIQMRVETRPLFYLFVKFVFYSHLLMRVLHFTMFFLLPIDRLTCEIERQSWHHQSCLSRKKSVNPRTLLMSQWDDQVSSDGHQDCLFGEKAEYRVSHSHDFDSCLVLNKLSWFPSFSLSLS
jgi:hypothetical protein